MLVIKEYNSDYFENFKEFLLEKGFAHIGSGHFRAGYRRKNIVIKVPENKFGFEDNILEAHAYKIYRNKPDKYGRVFAPARLLTNACVMMPFITKIDESETNLPKWCLEIDNVQCGYYKDKIVVYDSA